MEDLAFGELSIEVGADLAAGPMKLVWRGKSSDRQPSRVLTPYLSRAVTAAAGKRVGMELHFEGLEHFNSSTVTSIIQLVQEARSNGVKLSMVYDPRLKWQRLSFDALRVFVKGDGLLELIATEDGRS
jgi:hypothetical protein